MAAACRSSINVSEAGTAIAASLAAHARQGRRRGGDRAACPITGRRRSRCWSSISPPSRQAGQVPLFVLNSPAELNEVEFAGKSVVELLGRLSQFAGLIDMSLDWQYMIEVVTVARAARPDFQFVSGNEYMISAGAIGATGMLSPLASVSPRLVRGLYDLCRAEKYQDALGLQQEAAILFRLFRDAGVPGLKAAARLMGRDCGGPRPPLPALADTKTLAAELAGIAGVKSEPRGWA